MEEKENIKVKLHQCFLCDFQCRKVSLYKKHLLTNKHIFRKECSDKKEEGKGHVCTTCKKFYKHLSSLSNHKKKCLETTALVFTTNTPVTINPHEDEDEHEEQHDVKSLTNVMLTLLKQNGDLQNQIMEMCKIPHCVNNNNNNHTNSFNLNFFLNETCKDAMNITEFVDSFTLQLTDLESVGELGYVEGMTRIILKKLNELEITKRPIHCSDVKRDTLHIRNNNRWEKDLTLLQHAIKRISKKNSDLLLDWKHAHPNVHQANHQQNDQYLTLIKESMGGRGDYVESVNKIMRNIGKGMIISK